MARNVTTNRVSKGELEHGVIVENASFISEICPNLILSNGYVNYK